jgi:hypothetical protein
VTTASTVEFVVVQVLLLVEERLVVHTASRRNGLAFVGVVRRNHEAGHAAIIVFILLWPGEGCC